MSRPIETFLGLIFLGMVLLAQGCGGGGGSSPAPEPAPAPPDTGELIIGITDAPADYSLYEVDVLQLTLERANGDVVDTLPLSTRIDFARLTEVTEFLSVATVPVGNYESVSVRMDFTNAEIWVQKDGEDVQAQPVDDQGEPLGEIEVRLNLTTSDVIRIRPGIPAAFSLDFDLAASNDVNFDVDPPEVMVDPFLLATPELETDREHRVRGVLKDVNVEENEFTLRVRPFRHRTGRFGEFTVMVDEETQYEVDGQGYTGPDGLSAMADLELNAPVVAHGSISGMGMQADVVLAGTSVPWADADVVRGVVAAREGDALTVKGAYLHFADGTHAFRGTYTVLLGDGTTVTAPGVDNASLTIQSISVGQRVVAWGELADDRTLDATEGRVRMRMNQLTGAVAQAEPLAVDLFYLNGRKPDSYHFAGTGQSEAEDADPAFYEIDTGVLALDLVEGELVRVRGLVNEFGAAPPDFLARTVIDVETDWRAAYLGVWWPLGTSMPFTSVAPDRIDVDLTEARKILKLRGVPRELIEHMESVAMIAPDSGRGVYAVKVRGAGEIHVYRSFADMTEELTEQLDDGRILHRIGATGRYNTLTDELTTGRASFVFTAPEEVD